MQSTYTKRLNARMQCQTVRMQFRGDHLKKEANVEEEEEIRNDICRSNPNKTFSHMQPTQSKCKQIS